MDFAYTPEEEAFRQELRAWLEPNLREHRAQWGMDEDEFAQHPNSLASLAWHKRMYEGGVGRHAVATSLRQSRRHTDGAGHFY